MYSYTPVRDSVSCLFLVPYLLALAMVGSNTPLTPVSLLLLLILVAGCPRACTCIRISYEVVKSPLYPRLPAGLKSFRDPPVHGPVVAVQVWYGDSKVFGIQTTFLDKHKSSVHGYAVGNTTTVTYDPSRNVFLTTAGITFDSLSADGTVGTNLVALLTGTRTASLQIIPLEANTQETSPDVGLVLFGATVSGVVAAGYGPVGIVLGLTGTVDDVGITQLGFTTEARSLSFKQSTSGGHGYLHWPKEAVIRSKQFPRLPAGLRPFDDGLAAEHGEIVKVQLWLSETGGVRGIRSTFKDGHQSPLYGVEQGQNITLEFDPKSNPLVALGGRGGPVRYDLSSLVGDSAGEYRLLAVAFFSGVTSPPTRSPDYGSRQIRTYSDSADGKVVGFFGQLGDSYVAQLGVHVVSPANGLLVSSGPFPRVSPSQAVPFDHTGDNTGVYKIDVYYDNFIGIRGLGFTYVTHLGFKYTTPVYGKKLGLYKQLQFDYLNNPLVNVGVYISNLLAGTGEVGIAGLTFHTRKGDFLGTFGVLEVYYNITDGTKRIVGFHGLADTVVNALGVYSAPL